MCSWKYAGAYVSPKGTLMYLYFPNGEVKAVLGMDASFRNMVVSCLKVQCGEIFCTVHLREISSTLGMGQMNFLVTLLSAR